MGFWQSLLRIFAINQSFIFFQCQKKFLPLLYLLDYEGCHLDKAPRYRRATRVFQPEIKVQIKFVTNYDICCSKKFWGYIGIWYPWHDAFVLFDIIYSLWTICGQRNIDFYFLLSTASHEIKWNTIIVIWTQ